MAGTAQDAAGAIDSRDAHDTEEGVAIVVVDAIEHTPRDGAVGGDGRADVCEEGDLRSQPIDITPEHRPGRLSRREALLEDLLRRFVDRGQAQHASNGEHQRESDRHQEHDAALQAEPRRACHPSRIRERPAAPVRPSIDAAYAVSGTPPGITISDPRMPASQWPGT